MKITLAQMEVSRELPKNLERILEYIAASAKEDWVIFPEGALTGYFPQDNLFLENVQPDQVNNAIKRVVEAVKEKQCNCLLGTASPAAGGWYNSVAIISAEGKIEFYNKVALSEVDKKHFLPGDKTNIYKLNNVTFGIQVCRELVFPEQWQNLRHQGAQIIFHINNAIKPYDSIWEHIIIARAVENQFFVCSVNNSSEPGELLSYLVDPAGRVVLKSDKQVSQALTLDIDLVNFKSPY